MLIEATSDFETLTAQSTDNQTQLQAAKAKYETLHRDLTEARQEAVACKNAALKLVHEAQTDNPDLYDFIQEYSAKSKEFLKKEQRELNSQDLEEEIDSEQERLQLLSDGGLNEGLIRDFEARAKKIEALQKKLESVRAGIDELEDKIKEVRGRWEGEVDGLVDRISQGFGYNMGEIGCAGEVGVHKDEESFEEWAIHIRVKFR